MPTIRSISRRRASAAAVCVLAGAVVAAGAITLGLVSAAAPAPPVPTITSHPSSPNPATSGTFAFREIGASRDPDNDHNTDAVVFKCSLDGGAYSTCSSPKTYNGIHDGTHTFRVTAQQEGTAVSAPASFTWVVSSQPPAVALNFPANNHAYNTASWNAGCAPSGLCGSASSLAGIASVQLSLQRHATGKYWNGSSFSSSSQVFLSATLASQGASSTGWCYSLPANNFPSDGDYTTAVRATDSFGHVTAAAHYVKAAWTLDRAAPPTPSITSGPANPTTSTSATFMFNDAEHGVNFECRLDGSAYQSCTSPKTYSALATQGHTFRVAACDAANNCSGPAAYSWTVNGGFGIAGDPTGTFFPGAPALPIDLSITNPFNTTLTVTSVQVTVTGTSVSGCDASNFSVAQNFAGAVDIPANSTETLQDAGVPSSEWPSVQMLDTSSDQDVCHDATVHLSYSGSGTHS